MHKNQLSRSAICRIVDVGMLEDLLGQTCRSDPQRPSCAPSKNSQEPGNFKANLLWTCSRGRGIIP